MAPGDTIRNRRSVKAFATTPVPDETIAEVLRLMQRAPTSLNMQSYVTVLVRKQEDRGRLAGAMLHSNVQKVKDAPVVVVIAADTEPGLGVERIQGLKREHGVPPSKIVNMPRDVRLVSHHGLDDISKSPLGAPPIAWAFKQATYAAATLLFAAHEFGLVSCPMEGFHETRVRRLLEIPDRFAIPVITCLGYPQDGAVSLETPRLPPTEVIFDGKFGHSSDALFDRK